MSVKCIALDMDRTTLNAQGMLSEENKKAIRLAIEKGIHVVIASGRVFSSLPGEVTERSPVTERRSMKFPQGDV